MSTALILVFLMGFVVVGTMTLTASMNSNRGADRSTQSLQAMNLAEAGIQAMYDTIRTNMVANNTYPFEITSTEMTSNHRGSTQSMGRYVARVVDMQSSQEDIGPDHDRDRVTNYTFVVESTGVAPDGISYRMRARFVASRGQNLVRQETVIREGPPTGQFYFPSGAILSNTRVEMVTNTGIRTFSPDGRSGHVVANEGIVWSTATGNKSSNVNPNVIDIQGQYIVHQDAEAFTRSSGGLGNSNGRVNYRSPSTNGMNGWPDMPANSVIAARDRVSFASSGEVDTWVNEWRARVARPDAQRFTQANLSSNDVPQRQGDQWRVIRAPAYLDGNLNIENGQQVRFIPSSSDPRDNVIYVRGNVTNMGQLLNLGVKVVIEGQYNDSPSAEYRLDTQGSPFGTMPRILQHSALISVNQSSSAIRFSTNSSVTTGLIYSAKGGIRVDSANAEFRGMLVAGGTGNNGGIEIRPGGGNSFVVHMTPEAAIPADIDAGMTRIVDVNYVPSSVAWAFSPSPLRDWVERAPVSRAEAFTILGRPDPQVAPVPNGNSFGQNGNGNSNSGNGNGNLVNGNSNSGNGNSGNSIP